MSMAGNAVRKAVDAFRKGKFVIIVDDEHRENEGDVVVAAQDITPRKVNFMVTHGRGLLCVPMEKRRLDGLDIPIMVEDNEERTRCVFTVSVDARTGITTGISAHDRARTIRLLADSKTKAPDLVRPGHVFPLMAAAGGLEARKGHTEASLELCRLAGKYPVAAICEILNTDGTMARLPQLKVFSRKHHIPLVTIKELERHLEAG